MREITCFVAFAMGLAFASCKRAQPVVTEPPPRTFTVQGILRAIDFAGQSVSVEHEDIPDFMPAMTMPFDVKSMREVEPLKAGDAIEFTLNVTDHSSWIEGVKKIATSEIQLPPRQQFADAPGEKVARLKEGDEFPDFRLIDSKGRPLTRETFAGKPLLLTFIFTLCPIPNYCPLMTGHFREIQQTLAAEPLDTAKVQLLSISFDPEFDTPEVLAQYAARQSLETDQWLFATGTAAETRRLTDAFSLSVQAEAGTISHGLATALIDADGVIRHIWRGNGWKPADVIEALRKLSP